MGRTKQGGSVLSFIIVGIVLLGVLAGGVYLYKHVWAPGAQTQTASKPTSPSESTSPAQNDTSSPPSDSSNSSSGSSNSSSNSSPNQPAQPQPSPAPQSASQLPTTGPADTLATLLALGALAAAATAYMQSRRAVRPL